MNVVGSALAAARWGRVFVFGVAGALLAVVAIGCGRGGIGLAPVEGVVTIDGAPLADAGVLFFPNDPKMGQPATGETDAEGRFTLVTASREGAAIGEHLVAIAKDKTTAIPNSGRFPQYKVTSFIPNKYADPKASGLTANVRDDDNYFEFALKSR